MCLPYMKMCLKSNPGFSKTTVYNALKSLCESGFITAITIDGGRIHYDANVNFHGHFICKHCGEIYDFQLEEPVSTPAERIYRAKKRCILQRHLPKL
ncbi:MAG: transcriptional repressor [Anaerotruncus sp.]|nr:MAG: transcriptional repressor [Anaerotruncus sp.]